MCWIFGAPIHKTCVPAHWRTPNRPLVFLCSQNGCFLFPHMSYILSNRYINAFFLNDDLPQLPLPQFKCLWSALRCIQLSISPCSSTGAPFFIVSAFPSFSLLFFLCLAFYFSYRRHPHSLVPAASSLALSSLPLLVECRAFVIVYIPFVPFIIFLKPPLA